MVRGLPRRTVTARVRWLQIPATSVLKKSVHLSSIADGWGYFKWLKKAGKRINYVTRHDLEMAKYRQDDEGVPIDVLIENFKKYRMIPSFVLRSQQPDAIFEYLVDVFHHDSNKPRFAAKMVTYYPVITEIKTYTAVYSLPNAEDENAEQVRGGSVPARGDPGKGNPKVAAPNFYMNCVGYQIRGQEKQPIRIYAVRMMQGYSSCVVDPEKLGWVKIRYDQTRWGFHYTTVRAYRSIREHGLRPGRDCPMFGDNRRSRPDIYMSGQFRGSG